MLTSRNLINNGTLELKWRVIPAQVSNLTISPKLYLVAELSIQVSLLCFPRYCVWSNSIPLFCNKNGNPLQYSCLKNSTDREDWQAAVHGVTKELDTTEWAPTHIGMDSSPLIQWSRLPALGAINLICKRMYTYQAVLDLTGDAIIL